MCVATTGRVVNISGNMAQVDISGNRCPVYIALTRAKVGDYVLVHAGCALEIVRKEQSEELASLLAEVEALGRDDNR